MFVDLFVHIEGKLNVAMIFLFIVDNDREGRKLLFN